MYRLILLPPIRMSWGHFSFLDFGVHINHNENIEVWEVLFSEKDDTWKNWA